MFHYTNPTGLLGICDAKQLWAGRASDMNDETEQLLAIERGRQDITNWLNVRRPATQAVVELLERMRAEMQGANRQIYTVSLSVKRDVLSRWRAYCPRSGGAALGLPAAQLRAAAHDQGFYLARCLYDNASQWRLIHELVQNHVDTYSVKCANSPDGESKHAEAAVKALAQDVARYGPLIKHESFAEEHEWRLVSAPSHVADARLIFRPGATGYRVYLLFDLLTPSHPTFDTSVPGDGPGVVVGPSVDSNAEQLAVQMVLDKNFGSGCWHGRTDSPYR